MMAWFAGPMAAAWVQAVGTIIAILVAVYIPWRQRRNDAARNARLEREHSRRLTTGFRAEIEAAKKTADRREFAIKNTLLQVDRARRSGITVSEPGPIQPGSLTLSDATIYKELAADIGRFPPSLISNIVTFYSLVFDVDRISNGAPTAIQAYRELLGSLPRFKMHAAVLMTMLNKFETAGFSANGDLIVKPEEMRKLAEETGYPLDEVLKERGLTLGSEGPVSAIG